MKFARLTYLIAAIYGLAVLLPGLFLEARVSAMEPPPLTHPEFYYGFYGSALVWQLAFFLIASDPARYRPLMLVSLFEKASFLASCLILWRAGRLAPGGPLYGSLIDGFWIIPFSISWLKTRPDSD